MERPEHPGPFEKMLQRMDAEGKWDAQTADSEQLTADSFLLPDRQRLRLAGWWGLQASYLSALSFELFAAGCELLFNTLAANGPA